MDVSPHKLESIASYRIAHIRKVDSVRRPSPQVPGRSFVTTEEGALNDQYADPADDEAGSNLVPLEFVVSSMAASIHNNEPSDVPVNEIINQANDDKTLSAY